MDAHDEKETALLVKVKHEPLTRPHLVDSTKDDTHLLQLATIKQEPVTPLKRSSACSFLGPFFCMFLCFILIFSFLDSQVNDFVDDGFSTNKFTPAAISPARLDP